MNEPGEKGPSAPRASILEWMPCVSAPR